MDASLRRGAPGAGTRRPLGAVSHALTVPLHGESFVKIKLRYALPAAGAAVLVAGAIAVAPTADAAISASPLVNPASGKCLDLPGGNTADGTAVAIWACHGGANQ